jgi:hypothetical protein
MGMKLLKLKEKPKGLSVDKPLLNINLSIEDIEHRYSIEFEEADGQGGPIKDCLVQLNDKYFVYIHKWKFEGGEVRVSGNCESNDEFKILFKYVMDFFKFKDDEIVWVSPFVKKRTKRCRRDLKITNCARNNPSSTFL